MAAAYFTRESNLVDDADAVKALWLDNFASYTPARALAKLRLGYLQNPAGRGGAVLLHREGEAVPAGVQCLHPRTFYHGPRKLDAANLADYTVAAAHRSLGPALMLMKSSVGIGRQRYELVYGIPNKSSAAVCARAGLVRIGAMARYAVVLRSRPYLERRLPRALAIPIGALADAGLMAARSVRHRYQQAEGQCAPAPFGDAITDHAWERRATNLMLSDRSARMLQWRYGDPSRGDWQLCVFRDVHGEPSGHVVWQMRNGVADVGDFYTSRPDDMTVPLMLAFKRHARRQGATSVTLEFLGGPAVRTALLSVGFRPRSEEVMVFRGTSAELDTLPESTWYFTGFDNDAD